MSFLGGATDGLLRKDQMFLSCHRVTGVARTHKPDPDNLFIAASLNFAGRESQEQSKEKPGCQGVGKAIRFATWMGFYSHSVPLRPTPVHSHCLLGQYAEDSGGVSPSSVSRDGRL